MVNKIGNYEIHSVQTGLFKLDGGAMFGVVPKSLWNRSNPSDEYNRIDMCTRAMLLKGNGRKILVDTGIGYKLSDKLNKIYDVNFSQYTLEKSLNSLGLKMDEITDVILTHLHFDHAGGNTYYDEEKKLKLSFPNATYHVQKEHFEWALNPTERDKASFFPENYLLLDEKKVLNKISGEFELDEQITLLPVYGHTPAMQLVKVSDDDNTMLYLADLIPTAGHTPLPYIMGYDLFPLTTLDEKKYFLNEIAENKWKVFFEHDPHNETGNIIQTEKGFMFSKSTE
ncbi:MAG TPA: MBL fold metallo-hydrolase [Ignavibacteria bacterium]|nr:MBL fold metallo-hydrolase [Ignavibacteria bacterium]